MNIIYILVLVLVCVLVYQLLPYSPVKSEFWCMVEEYTKKYKSGKKITENELQKLPEILQKYFINNGYLGTKSANSVIFTYKKADFSLGVNKPNVIMDYLVYSYVAEPTRLVLIDTKIYGIPFQGIDTCKDGKGSMKGIIAKHIPIFNNIFDNFIDSSYLAECLLHPSLALQDNISYNQIDDYRVEAIIRKYGAETKGVFHFNERYEMEQFVVEKDFLQKLTITRDGPQLHLIIK